VKILDLVSIDESKHHLVDRLDASHSSLVIATGQAKPPWNPFSAEAHSVTSARTPSSIACSRVYRLTTSQPS